MAASYLVKKADTYYFRHSLSATTRQHHGKREFIKSLKVSRKSEAVSLSRELKIVFDLVMKKSEKNPTILHGKIFDRLLTMLLILFINDMFRLLKRMAPISMMTMTR